MNRVAIPKNGLMLIAGVVWCIAGTMVSGVGIPLLWEFGFTQEILYPLAGGVFLIFYFLIFSRLVVKHTERIRERPEQRLPFWNFFDAPSFVVMAIMMGGGMWLRLSRVVPNWMIAFFYSGLGVALFFCGIRFLGAFYRKDVLMVTVEASDPNGPIA
jgi:hypothetical protein